MGFHFIGHFDLFWVMCGRGHGLVSHAAPRRPQRRRQRAALLLCCAPLFSLTYQEPRQQPRIHNGPRKGKDAREASSRSRGLEPVNVLWYSTRSTMVSKELWGFFFKWFSLFYVKMLFWHVLCKHWGTLDLVKLDPIQSVSFFAMTKIPWSTDRTFSCEDDFNVNLLTEEWKVPVSSTYHSRIKSIFYKMDNISYYFFFSFSGFPTMLANMYCTTPNYSHTVLQRFFR